MNSPLTWLRRVRNLLRSNRLSRDIEREMAFHVAERTDEFVRSGMSEQEAAREAERLFGRRSALRETTRDIDVLTWLESWVADGRLAMRQLRASPAFTLVAVLSLALGIGANTAIFSLINAVMLTSLPVRHADRLVTLTSASFGSELSNPIWESMRDRQRALPDMAAFSPLSFNLASGGVVRRVSGNWVSGDYFATLGVSPEAGRLLQRADDVRGCAPVAVLSHGFWQGEYGGSLSAIGGTISLDGHPFTIIGVTPPAFFGVEVGKNQQIYAPLCAMAAVGRGDMLDEKHGWFLSVIGHLSDGQGVRQAEVELSRVTGAVLEDGLAPAQYARAKDDLAKNGFQLSAGVGDLSAVRQEYSTALLTLMGVVAVVLCIGCANVANLLLARAATRQREIAVRFALGASRLRVMRQLLTETLLLTAIGAALGVLFARWSTGALLALLGSGRNSVSLAVPMDVRVLLFTAAVASVIALFFGLAPAWRSTRTNPQDAMRAHGRTVVPGHSRFTVVKALVVGQVALSLVLVMGAGLLLGTFRTLATLDLGFTKENVLLVTAGFDDAADNDPLHTEAMQLEARLRTLAGVTSVSISSGTPVGVGAWNGGIEVDGYVPKKRRDALVFLAQVTGEYFATLRTPLLSGRTFDQRDQLNGPKVAVINQAAARRYFANTNANTNANANVGANAVGRRFRVPMRKGDVTEYEVIGVVADAKIRSVKETPRPQVFLPLSQSAALNGAWHYELRTTGDIRSVVGEVTSLVQQVNPRTTLEFRTLDAQIGASIARERVLATLSVFFGALALLLATIGLYGTMSYSVERRRNEIGVRLALGAARATVFRLVLREVGTLLVVGLFFGAAGARGAARFVSAFLYGVTPTDGVTLAWSTVVLASVALVAGALPAWRAARLDPMTALRDD